MFVSEDGGIQVGGVMEVDNFTVLFYKLIVKALSMRIRLFMDSWVESEQRGFVTGYSVADNFLLFREVKSYAYVSGQEVTFFVYDRLEWYFFYVSFR